MNSNRGNRYVRGRRFPWSGSPQPGSPQPGLPQPRARRTKLRSERLGRSLPGGEARVGQGEESGPLALREVGGAEGGILDPPRLALDDQDGGEEAGTPLGAPLRREQAKILF